MRLHEFVSHPDLQLPIRRDSNVDIAAFLDARFDRFLRLTELLESRKAQERIRERGNDLQQCCDGIVSCIRAALRGSPHDASEQFDSAMNLLRGQLAAQAIELDATQLGLMYRARRSLTPRLSREQLFHVPFEDRHLVDTHRYSIPGLPCLYLCGSLYACWEELGRPPLHELQVAAFRVKMGRRLKILNFSDRPARFSRFTGATGAVAGQDALDEGVANHFVLWPLIAACSMLVQHRNAPFKVEYLIPQMALQWVTKNKDIDGICYSCTSIPAIPSSHVLAGCSLVFPAKEIAARGRCRHLCESFQMTEPVSWELLRAITVRHSMIDHRFTLELIDGIEDEYEFTEFGRMQAKLQQTMSQLDERIENGDTNCASVTP